MIATPRLRFVVRDCHIPVEPFFGGGTQVRRYQVLQQYWVPVVTSMTDVEVTGEWRDVPLETEET